MNHPSPDTHARASSRTPMLIGGVFVLLGGIFIGALSTTVLLRTSFGSAGDIKARDAIRLQALIEAPEGRAPAEVTAERATSEFAHSFVISAAALDATASRDDRARVIAISHWLVRTGALAERDDAVSRWAVIAARCVVEFEQAVRDAAVCVRDRMPLDVPIPDHARD